jgi:hypothetical protein
MAPISNIKSIHNYYTNIINFHNLYKPLSPHKSAPWVSPFISLHEQSTCLFFFPSTCLLILVRKSFCQFLVYLSILHINWFGHMAGRHGQVYKTCDYEQHMFLLRLITSTDEFYIDGNWQNRQLFCYNEWTETLITSVIKYDSYDCICVWTVICE